jgi:hypothetical protein
MATSPIGWEGPPLTTTSSRAAGHYRDGVAALVSGRANADRLLDAALDHDPGFLLARVARAVCDVVAGGAYVVPSATDHGRVARGERQHAEVVATMLRGERTHAHDLRREHLVEYPGDLLIVWLPMLTGC